MQAIAFGAILAIGLGGQAPATRTIGASDGAHVTLGDGLTFYDAHGIARGYLGFTTKGLPVIREFDASGALRQDLALAGDGYPILNQQSSNGTVRMSIASFASGNGDIALYGPDGKRELSFFESSDHHPNAIVYGPNAQQSGYLAADDAGGYGVLRDPAGNARVSFGAFTDNSFGINVRAADQRVQWSAP